MTTVKNQTGRGSWISTALLGILLLALFGIGIKLGMTLFAPQNQAAASIAAVAGGTGDQPSGGALVNPPFLVKDYPLRNQADAPMTLSDLRGRTALLFFGYTHCPDVCPTTMADLTRVKVALGADADKVAFVFVSIDPQRDTPATMKDFLKVFDPTFIGLTGTEATMQQMATEFGAPFALPEEAHQHNQALSNNNYFVKHTSPVYVVDAKSYLRMVYFYGTSTDVIASGVRKMLAS